LKRCEGYIYFELLASFFICSFMAVSIFPIYMKIEQDRQNIKLKVDASHVLYGVLESYMDDGILPIDTVFSYNKRDFQITWGHENQITKMIEGCVKYQNAEKTYETICDTVRR
jgi:hypothetical protein